MYLWAAGLQIFTVVHFVPENLQGNKTAEKTKNLTPKREVFGAPAGTRILDPLIKSTLKTKKSISKFIKNKKNSV